MGFTRFSGFQAPAALFWVSHLPRGGKKFRRVGAGRRAMSSRDVESSEEDAQPLLGRSVCACSAVDDEPSAASTFADESMFTRVRLSLIHI